MFVNKHFANFVWLHNSRIPRIKNAKLSVYYIYMNITIQGDFQICISLPLMLMLEDSET